jgi:transposase
VGDLSNFERGQIVDAQLAGASVTKTATILGIPGATVSKVTSAYTNHGKATSAKKSSGQKSTLTERDHCTLRRTLLKNHSNCCSTGDSRTEYSSRRPFFHKNCPM